MKNNSNRLFSPGLINIWTGESGILAVGGVGAVLDKITALPWMSDSGTDSIGTANPGLDDAKIKMRTRIEAPRTRFASNTAVGAIL
jgi:hypothetical protein